MRKYDTMFSQYPDVVDIEQLQKMLKIGRKSAYDLVRSGKIRSIMIGHKYRIPKVYVTTYLTEGVYHD